jgi:hypothetical protein
MAARPKVLKTTCTEKQVTAQVIEAATMLGIELKRRNVGGMTNATGRYVRFGEAGDADHYAVISDGRHLDLEIKHEGFDPRKLRGDKKAHFARQLSRLRKTNALGGVGLWVRDAGDFIDAMRKVLDGWRVEIDESGFCWLLSPDEH